jgi:hypothetical protein
MFTKIKKKKKYIYIYIHINMKLKIKIRYMHGKFLFYIKDKRDSTLKFVLI